MSVWRAILWKDLVSEWRSRERVVSMGLFALLATVVFHFALPSRAELDPARAAPGLLWAAYLFAALLGFNRAFALETEHDALSALALAPADRGWIFLGKASANFVLLGLVQALTAVAFALAFDLDLAGIALPLSGVVALGSLGMCSLGTLFGAIAVRTRFREIMLPLLMLPLMAPVLLGAVHATAALLRDGSVPDDATRLLLVTDAVYLIVSFVGFEYVLDE